MKLQHVRVHLRLPTTAAEHAVVPDAGLEVMALLERAETPAQVVGGQGLPDRADVVALALDREQRGAPDGRRVDRAAAQVGAWTEASANSWNTASTVSR